MMSKDIAASSRSSPTMPSSGCGPEKPTAGETSSTRRRRRSTAPSESTRIPRKPWRGRRSHTSPRAGRLEAVWSLARWDEVVKEASKGISLDPRHAGALYAKAHACIQLNRREEAVAALDGFLAVEPRSYDGLEAKRDLLLRTEQWSDLVVACDAILAIQPHHPRALKVKGRALLALSTAEAAYP